MEDVASLMSNCSDDELFEFVNDNRKYEDIAVLAALQEIEKRGKMLPEARQLKNKLLQKLNITDENAVVIDPQIQLFSEWTVFGFSLFFSSLFGAILLAYNMHKIGKTKKIIFPILFGFIFSISESLLQKQIHYLFVSLAITLIGAIIIKEFFWKLYIGKSVAYTQKSNLVPVLIGLAVVAFLLITISMNGGALPTLPK